MRAFAPRDGVLHADGVSLVDIAEQVGTPVYVYVAGYFRARYAALQRALAGIDAEICYAVKANSNLSVLGCFRDLGAGFDIVSAGELQRVLCAGGQAARVVFSGVGKRVDEIDLALKHRIGCFNVESASELDRLADRAHLLGCTAPMSVRVNPGVDARTHPYIATGLANSKFGVPPDQARALYARAARHPALRVVGLACHIGSQIETPAPLLEALDGLLGLADDMRGDGIELEHIDLGGGLGVDYRQAAGATPDAGGFDVQAYGDALVQAFRGRPERLVLEPGRYLVANGGILLTRVEYLKPRGETGFAIVDAAMNDLIRPALYRAWHAVVPVVEPAAGPAPGCWDVVGPVCESGDFLAHGRELPVAEGALLALCSAGAYGMVQSSNYNSRGRPAEVLVDGDTFTVARRRETIRDQLAPELPGDHPDALAIGTGEG